MAKARILVLDSVQEIKFELKPVSALVGLVHDLRKILYNSVEVCFVLLKTTSLSTKSTLRIKYPPNANTEKKHPKGIEEIPIKIKEPFKEE